MLENVYENHTFIKRSFTVDVKWVYEHDVEVIEQLVEWCFKNESKL